MRWLAFAFAILGCHSPDVAPPERDASPSPSPSTSTVDEPPQDVASAPTTTSSAPSRDAAPTGSANAKHTGHRVRCGKVLCYEGQVCCNPLMDICTPPGMACPQ